MRLGIVLPSRGRPDGAKRMIESLMDNAMRPDLVTVYLGVDTGDPTLRAYEALSAKVIARDPETTVARMIDNLSLAAEGETEAVIRMDDDFICVTERWDCACETMTGLGLWRVGDPTHARGHISFPAMSSEMAAWLRAEQGFVHAPWFPFWFTDTWLTELGAMSGMTAPLAFDVEQPGGRGATHGLRDLRFWADFFEMGRPMRSKVAEKLILASYPKGCLREAALYALPMRALHCAANVEHLRDPAFIAKFEARADEETGTAPARYLRARRDVEEILEAA